MHTNKSEFVTTTRSRTSTASRAPVRDCFLAVLSSHGEDGCVFGADGKPVRLARIFALFDSPCMTNKTKLFFIQACRGSDLDGGVEVDSATHESTDEPFSQSLSVPVDTAVIYATPPGNCSYKSKNIHECVINVNA